MPTSVRLDPKTGALLSRLARAHGRSKSQIIREAIARLARDESPRGQPRPYELMADLIGIAHGGPSDLARRSSEVFKEILQTKARSR